MFVDRSQRQTTRWFGEPRKVAWRNLHFPANLRKSDVQDAVALRDPRNRLGPDLLVEIFSADFDSFGRHDDLRVRKGRRKVEAASDRTLLGAALPSVREGQQPRPDEIILRGLGRHPPLEELPA